MLVRIPFIIICPLHKSFSYVNTEAFNTDYKECLHKSSSWVSCIAQGFTAQRAVVELTAAIFKRFSWVHTTVALWHGIAQKDFQQHFKSRRQVSKSPDIDSSLRAFHSLELSTQWPWKIMPCTRKFSLQSSRKYIYDMLQIQNTF